MVDGGTHDSLNPNELIVDDEVEKKLWPERKGNWLIFKLGRSLVLAPHEVKTIQWPYYIHAATGAVRDCLHNRNVRVWLKWRSTSQMICVLQNLSAHPQQLTSKSRCLMLESGISKILLPSGIQEDLHKLQVSTPLEHWMKKYPQVFDDSIQGMAHITPDMRKQAISSNQIHWITRLPRISGVQQTVHSIVEKEEIGTYLEELEGQGVIERVPVNARGLYSQAMFLRKKSGDLRCVIDFRKLNTLCSPWIFPIPSTVRLAMSVPKEWSVFTVLDISNGFHNIPLDESIRDIFSFCTPCGQYRYCRLPQGWHSSPGLFQCLMTKIFSGLPLKIYLDDFLLGTSCEEEMDLLIEEVLLRMKKFGLHLNPNKIQYKQQEVTFVGYTLEKQGRISCKTLVASLKRNLPCIQNVRHVQAMLGLLNQLRPFIRDLTGRVDYLTKIVQSKGKGVQWDELSLQAQHTWAELLGEVFMLQRPCSLHSAANRDATYSLYTDWSGQAMGCVLLKNDAPVWMSSQKCSPWKRAVSSLLGELKGIVWGLKQTAFISKQAHIRVYSDSYSNWLKLENKTTWHKEEDERIKRLLGYLLGNWHRISFHFIEGKANTVADRLSRWRIASNMDTCMIHQQQISDIDKAMILQHAHEGHWSTKKMVWNALRLYPNGWKTLTKDCMEYTRKCVTCQACSPYKKLSMPLGNRLARSVGEVVGCDMVGPLPNAPSNMKYAFIAVDGLSKWIHCTMCVTNKTTDAIRGVKEYIKRTKTKPTLVICDSGTHFTSSAFKTFIAHLGAQLHWSPAYCHKGNGLVERHIATWAQRIRTLKYEKGGHWSRYVQEAAALMNSAVHSTTREIPFELLHGHRLHDGTKIDATTWTIMQDEAFEREKKEWQLANQRLARIIQNNKSPKLHDRVWWYNGARASALNQKFHAFWSGPNILVNKVSNHLWDLVTEDHRYIKNVHVDNLKPFLT